MNLVYKAELTEEDMDALAAGACCLQRAAHLLSSNPPEELVNYNRQQAMLLLRVHLQAWRGGRIVKKDEGDEHSSQ